MVNFSRFIGVISLAIGWCLFEFLERTWITFFIAILLFLSTSVAIIELEKEDALLANRLAFFFNFFVSFCLLMIVSQVPASFEEALYNQRVRFILFAPLLGVLTNFFLYKTRSSSRARFLAIAYVVLLLCTYIFLVVTAPVSLPYVPMN